MNGSWDGVWDLTLVAHIVAGFVALVVGPGAMATRKGALWHRRWGKAFVAAMAAVAATAVVLATVRPNPFLLLVAVFSFYLAFTGYRVLARRRLGPGRLAAPLDWVGAVSALGGGAALIAWALLPRADGRPALWVVALVFGALAIGLAARDVHSLLRPAADPRGWWYRHMGNMLGAYIATVSAFSVVNFTFLPPAARWLWPTVVGVPLIVAWIRHYRRQFSTRATAAPRAGLTERGAASSSAAS